MDPTSVRPLAVAVVLVSGGLMVLTGVLAEAGSWGAATLVSILGAAAVQTGFHLPRRGEGASGSAAGRSGPPGGAVLAGALGLMLASGFLMAAAGYLAARGDWLPVPLLVLAGGVAILSSYLLDRRARRG